MSRSGLASRGPASEARGQPHRLFPALVPHPLAELLVLVLPNLLAPLLDHAPHPRASFPWSSTDLTPRAPRVPRPAHPAPCGSETSPGGTGASDSSAPAAWPP